MSWLYNIFKNLKVNNQDSVKRYCEVEYGRNWQFAYLYYQKNKSFPRFK